MALKYQLNYSGQELEAKLSEIDEKQTKLTAGNNISISPEGVISAAGDGSGGSITPPFEYTINGMSADSNGNFSVDLTTMGAAATEHTHSAADVIDLSTALASYAPIDHTHQMVTGLTVDGNTLNGSINLVAGNNVGLDVSDNAVTVSTTGYLYDSAVSFQNAENTSENVKFFIGTEAEWSAFLKDENFKYIVMITE